MIIAERLGMTLWQMRQQMPVAEMLRWITYFNESAPKEDVIDLSDTAALQKAFG